MNAEEMRKITAEAKQRIKEERRAKELEEYENRLRIREQKRAIVEQNMPYLLAQIRDSASAGQDVHTHYVVRNASARTTETTIYGDILKEELIKLGFKVSDHETNSNSESYSASHGYARWFFINWNK